MEFVIAGVITGLALIVALYLFFALLAERKEVAYLSDESGSYRKLANSHWDSYKEAYADLEAESHQLEVAEGLVDELEVALRFALADLEVAEAEIEELEEESDDLEESVGEALAGWAQADALSKTTLDWGERVLGLLERAEEERL